MQHSNLSQHNEHQRDYYKQKIKKTMLPGKTPYILRHFNEMMLAGEFSHDTKILEVGSGMGKYSFLFAEKGVGVECLELSPFLIEQFNEINGNRYNIPTHCGDIHYPPAELNKKFDAVVGFFILHHLLDLDQAFKAISQLLKPGGRVIFIEPNPYNPLYYLQISLSPSISWKAEKNILKMRPKPIFNAMKNAGLKKHHIKRFGFFPPFLTNRPWGQKLESHLEKFSAWQSVLPFQVFMGQLD